MAEAVTAWTNVKVSPRNSSFYRFITILNGGIIDRISTVDLDGAAALPGSGPVRPGRAGFEVMAAALESGPMSKSVAARIPISRADCIRAPREMPRSASTTE